MSSLSLKNILENKLDKCEKNRINSCKDVYKKTLQGILNNYSSNIINSVSLSQNLLTTKIQNNTTITAENIAEVVLPLVEYIREVGPDCVIACDR